MSGGGRSKARSLRSPPLLTATIKVETEGLSEPTLEAKRAALIKWKREELSKFKEEKSKLEKEFKSSPRNLRRSTRRPKSLFGNDFISLDFLGDLGQNETPKTQPKTRALPENTIENDDDDDSDDFIKDNNIFITEDNNVPPKPTKTRRKSKSKDSNGAKKGTQLDLTKLFAKNNDKTNENNDNLSSLGDEGDFICDSPQTPIITDFSMSSPPTSEPQSPQIKPKTRRRTKKEDKPPKKSKSLNTPSKKTTQKRSKKSSIIPQHSEGNNDDDDFETDTFFYNDVSDDVKKESIFTNESDDVTTDKIDSPPPHKIRKKYHTSKRKSTLSQANISSNSPQITDTPNESQQQQQQQQVANQEPEFTPLRDIWGDPTFFIPNRATKTFSVDYETLYEPFPDADRKALRRVDELRDARKWPGFSLTMPPRLLSAASSAALQFEEPSAQPPICPKSHWDYLLAEMEWLAKDFQEERKQKRSAAKKTAKVCAKKVKDRSTRAERKQKERESSLKRIAGFTARIVKRFWSDVDKIAQFKLKMKLDAEKSQAMTKHLDFMVGQTERLSQRIALDLTNNNNDDNNNNNNTTLSDTSQKSEHNQNPSKRKKTKGNNNSSNNNDDDDDDDDMNNNNNNNNEDDDMKEDLSAAGAITSRDKIEKAAEEAMAAQPTGSTLATTHVRTPIPFLLRGTLREYQHVGLDWLATMYEKRLNVILADDMGLGKTIMTISLLAHLAGERGVWGPHLIIVPSSTVMNWELELRKWCPALKVLTYIGTPKERKARRAGWAKENALHVCITSYRIALQDAQLLKRKKWCYMILDEAQNIKNFKSQRWQVLLQYHSERRLLLTGTPLQNSVMELWSLMHFLMPAVFASHAEFAEWFAVPLNALVESGSTSSAGDDTGLVARLHAVLRPFLLRRVKRVVEHDLPPKREVLVPCSLSRRQQLLYEEFIGAASTQETLASGSFFGVVNILMQLRKVCNHPDLFAPRPTESPFVIPAQTPIKIPAELATITASHLPLCSRGTRLPSWATLELEKSFFECRDSALLSLSQARNFAFMISQKRNSKNEIVDIFRKESVDESSLSFMDRFARDRQLIELEEDISCLTHYANVSRDAAMWSSSPLFGGSHLRNDIKLSYPYEELVGTPLIKTLEQRVDEWSALAPHYLFLHPKVLAYPRELWLTKGWSQLVTERERHAEMVCSAVKPILDLMEPIDIRLKMHFPDKRLLQYDCGKLQVLHPLLLNLRDEGHKVVLFTRKYKITNIYFIFKQTSYFQFSIFLMIIFLFVNRNVQGS